MVANKVEEIRCGLCWNAESARLNKERIETSLTSMCFSVAPWLWPKTNHSCGAIDFNFLAVIELRHQAIYADHTGLSVFEYLHGQTAINVKQPLI